MISISREEFEEAVDDALDSLPEEIARAIAEANLAILVEEEPTREQAGGAELLGLYEGVPLDRRSVFDGFRDALAANRAEFYQAVASGPFYGWLENDPRAEKYRTEQGYCFDETAFIEYLAQRFPDTPARFVEALGIDFGAPLPGEYKSCPAFNF